MKVFSKYLFNTWMMFISPFDDRVAHFPTWDVMTWSNVYIGDRKKWSNYV